MRRSIFRKTFAASAAGITLLLGAVGLTMSASSASVRPRTLENVAIGAATTSIVDMPVWVGQSDNYFAKHNLNVKFVALSAATTTTALLGNSVQFLSQTTADFLTDRGEGIPIESVECITKGSPLGVIVSAPFAQQHGITAKTPLKQVVQDLVGTTAASSSANTTAEMHILTQLYGVSPSQYTVATVSNIAADSVALEKNQAQWILTAEPTPLELQAEGYGVVVASSNTVYPFQPERYGMGQSLVVTDSYATGDVGIVREMVAGLQASVQYIGHHEKQVLPVAQANLPGVPRSVLLKSYSLIDFPSTGKENPNLWRTSIAFAIKSGAAARGRNVVEGVDWTNKYF